MPPRIVRTYAPTEQDIYAKEKREALDMWANHIAVTVAQANGDNVTRLRDRQK